MELPENYQWILDTLTTLSEKDEIKKVLEIGPGRMPFYRFLSDKGYEVHAIDGKKNNFFGNDTRVHEGQIEFLEDVFGQTKFDAIVASRVFSVQAQNDYRIPNPARYAQVAIAMAIDPSARREVEDSLLSLEKEMLASCFGQLRKGGYLIIKEDDWERVLFSESMAASTGFGIIEYSPSNVILQK